MPQAEVILDNFHAVADMARGASLLIRLLIISLAGLFIMRGKIISPLLAALAGALCVAAAMISVVFEDRQNLVIFALLFTVGLFWGREALTMPLETRPGRIHILLAGLAALWGLFYPQFVQGVAGPVLFAPVGLIPSPTLMVASAATIAAGRSFTLYAVVPTWIASAVFGIAGVFYLGVGVDWVLVAVVPVSIVAYFTSAVPAQARRKRPRRVR